MPPFAPCWRDAGEEMMSMTETPAIPEDAVERFASAADIPIAAARLILLQAVTTFGLNAHA